MPGVSAQMGSRPPSALPALPHARSGVPRIPPHPPTPHGVLHRSPSVAVPGAAPRARRCCAAALRRFLFCAQFSSSFPPSLPPPPLPRLPPRSFRLRKNPKGKTTRPQIRGGGAPAGEIYGIQRTGTAQGIFLCHGFCCATHGREPRSPAPPRTHFPYRRSTSLKFLKASKQQPHRLAGELLSAYGFLASPFIPVPNLSQPTLCLWMSRFYNNQAGGEERGNFC